MKDKIAVKLGRNVRELRLKKGLTQERLAELAHIHPVYVSNIENGIRNITVARAFKIARSLDCGISELFKGIKG